jgi:F-type H+-transporting ATPase subunit b
VKKILTRGVLAGLTLAVVLGVAPHFSEVRASAESVGIASTPEAQSHEKNQQEQDENYAYTHSKMVQKMGGMVGMDADQSAMAFQVINFLILAGLVGFGLVKILPKWFRDRSSSIQKELVDARTATEAAGARLGSIEERLTKLDCEIAAMRSQAEQDWSREEQRIRASVEGEKHSILAAAEQEIAAATSHAQKALQQFAAELAIEQAARKLVVTAETDRLLVQSFAKRLTGDESKKGQN